MSFRRAQAVPSTVRISHKPRTVRIGGLLTCLMTQLTRRLVDTFRLGGWLVALDRTRVGVSDRCILVGVSTQCPDAWSS
jgi:hypothetical protein